MAMIMPVFAVTEPMALPIAISVLPSAAAIVETMISGSVVAMDTTVAPIRNCGRPEASAIHVAASTNQSPPLTINASPSRNSKIVIMSDDDIRIPPCISQKDEKKTFCTRCAKSLVPVSRRKATGKPGDCWPCDCNYSLSAESSIEDFVPFVKRKHAGFGQIGKSDRKILRGRKVAVDISPHFCYNTCARRLSSAG